MIEQPREALLWRYSQYVDRLYWLELKQAAGGAWLVNCAYGVRGNELSKSTKTPNPVPYAVGATLYRIHYDERIAKGYQIVRDVTLLKTIPSLRTGPAAIAEPAAEDLSELLAETLRRLGKEPLLTINNSRSIVKIEARQPAAAPRKLRF